MAHFAKIGVNGKVILVVPFDDDRCLNADGIEDEEIGRQSLEAETGWPLWKQCSWNTHRGTHAEGKTPFRANYPGVGDYYNSAHDIFYAPRPTDMNGQPCTSWTLNTTTGLWTPPITKPIHENDPSVDEVPHYYEWDESAYQADNTKGWVLV